MVFDGTAPAGTLSANVCSAMFSAEVDELSGTPAIVVGVGAAVDVVSDDVWGCAGVPRKAYGVGGGQGWDEQKG